MLELMDGDVSPVAGEQRPDGSYWVMGKSGWTQLEPSGSFPNDRREVAMEIVTALIHLDPGDAAVATRLTTMVAHAKRLGIQSAVHQLAARSLDQLLNKGRISDEAQQLGNRRLAALLSS